ncbi:hypothetical protein C8J56DRAFT_419363 [Mycena floridula]|nr:hypothetical protein C8J56DRAFT_419363 [Mycena floridula]
MHKGLDSLYKEVLEDAKSYPNFGLVLGAFALFHGQFDVFDFCSHLHFESVKDVHLALRGCLSVMTLPELAKDTILPHHTSLLDFLTDSNRHQDQFFKSAMVHQHILFGCITHSIHWLQDSNPFGLNYTRDYAFWSWVYHLRAHNTIMIDHTTYTKVRYVIDPGQ